MKIEVNLEKRFVIISILIAIVIIGVAGVIAYNSEVNDPSIMGHSTDEMDWSKAINGNVTASGFCIGNDTTQSCISSWPSSSGGTAGVSKIIAGSGIIISAQTGDVMINSTATGGSDADHTHGIQYQDCAWVDGGNKALPQWSLANCSAINKTVAGFHFLKSNNDRENTEYELTPDYVRARRSADGSYMHAWGYCCKIVIA